MRMKANQDNMYNSRYSRILTYLDL